MSHLVFGRVQASRPPPVRRTTEASALCSVYCAGVIVSVVSPAQPSTGLPLVTGDGEYIAQWAAAGMGDMTIT